MYITTYFVSAETGQADCDVTNHTSGVKKTTAPLKLIHRAPGAQSNPGEEPLIYRTPIKGSDFMEQRLFRKQFHVKAGASWPGEGGRRGAMAPPSFSKLSDFWKF